MARECETMHSSRLVATMQIRLATTADVPALMALEQRHYVGNLDPSRREEGFISILHPREWFDAAVESGGVHVAARGPDELTGFIAVTDPPRDPDHAPSPILRAMTELANRLWFAGAPISHQRYAFRGPVLIDRGARGQGLYTRFNAVARDAYGARYDVLVLFVASDNPRSIHTTTVKLGAESLAKFAVEGKEYHFMAYSPSSD